MNLLIEMFNKCREIFGYEWHWDNFTFTLWDMFKLTLYLSVAGYCIGAVIHLNRGD